jgi:transposase
MPGFARLVAAEFLAATGGDITAHDSTARLPGVAGPAPVPRDSGRIRPLTMMAISGIYRGYGASLRILYPFCDEDKK